MYNIKRLFVATLFLVSFAFFCIAKDHQKYASTTVILDGKVTQVYFNDADTFRVLSQKKGLRANARARLMGFNALENYGPVHEFSKTSAHELQIITNKATKLARTGRWHCRTSNEKDTYNRLLVSCDDLAIALIKKGLAHVYTIDKSPGKKEYIKAQKYAREQKLGMWKHTTPKFIITSVHSAAEGHHNTYNRMISTRDGHTDKWYHNDNYRPCQKVCKHGSCMVYVPYKMRYGKKRAYCLR